MQLHLSKLKIVCLKEGLVHNEGWLHHTKHWWSFSNHVFPSCSLLRIQIWSNEKKLKIYLCFYSEIFLHINYFGFHYQLKWKYVTHKFIKVTKIICYFIRFYKAQQIYNLYLKYLRLTDKFKQVSMSFNKLDNVRNTVDIKSNQ